ncbi:MAG: hypothetical protein QXG44_07870 [Candidatus Jordarchaeaceae archaeon]
MLSRMRLLESRKRNLLEKLQSVLEDRYQEVVARLRDEKEIAKQSVKDALPDV